MAFEQSIKLDHTLNERTAFEIGIVQKRVDEIRLSLCLTSNEMSHA